MKIEIETMEAKPGRARAGYIPRQRRWNYVVWLNSGRVTSDYSYDSEREAVDAALADASRGSSMNVALGILQRATEANESVRDSKPEPNAAAYGNCDGCNTRTPLKVTRGVWLCGVCRSCTGGVGVSTQAP